MSALRNFDQLILIKQLFHDARDLAERGDRLSLTKSIILLDLSVEQMLKNILLNLDPNFIVPRGRNDITYRELWDHASRAVQDAKGVTLSERNESTRLHEFRNLVQHNGTVPTQVEVRRYSVATERMLSAAFGGVYDLDFGSFRPWDFVANDDLRRLLNESEDFLRGGNPMICIIGCKLAHQLIVEAIRRHTISEGPHFSARLGYRAQEQAESIGEFAEYVSKFNENILERVGRLENEVIAIGVGLPIIDTRRFSESGRVISTSIMADGGMDININYRSSREAETANANFMLDYLYRLVRLVEENHPGVLSEIKVKKALGEHGFIESANWYR